MASSIWRLATVALVTASTLTFIDPAQAAPTQTNTTLTISKGGNRTGPQAVSGLAGATFDFYEGTQAGPPPAAGSPGAVRSCTTAASGQCSVDLPGRTGGTGSGTEGYWIVERTAPAGYTIPTTLNVGVPPMTSLTYNGIFTGHVQNNQGYTFPQASTNNSNLQARGSIMADVRDNPALPGDCGLNIALLIDRSGSIAPFLSTVKDAANGFVDALTGTPSVIAVYSFAGDATQNLSPTAVSGAAGATAVKNSINGLSAGGGTNWDAGLFQIAAAPTTFDAVIMLTDGNPTFYGPSASGPGFQTRFREIENGIFSANALKALGTKVVAVGVGDGISGPANNLIAISGPVQGSDYIQTGYDELAEIFRQIALNTCAGTVSVVKMVIPPTGTIADGVPASGWTFSTSTPDVTPPSGQTAMGSGAVSFSADLDGKPSLPVTITETQQAGYTLVQNGGLNATCSNGGNPVTSTNAGALGFTVDALRNAIVSCVVYNRAPLPPASVLVNKKWRINGQDYNEGQQPLDFQANLILSGESKPVWGQVYSGYAEGDRITIDETIDELLLPIGCTNTRSGDLGNHTLVAGLNTFEVRNTVTCVTKLTLLKEIFDPSEMPAQNPTAWTLSAYPPGSVTPIMSGPTGVNNTVDAGVAYSLGESTVAGYVQEIVPSATIVPPSTGSWHCVLRLKGGGTSPEFDGLNGTVTVQLGRHAECTAKNLPLPLLTLKKSVTNSHGGTAVPADWTLNAIPEPNDKGAVPISGHNGEPAVTNAYAVPHVDYSLSETGGPAGYDQVGTAQCADTETGTPVNTPDGKLKLEYGDDVTCTFVNQDKAPPPPPPTPTPQPDLPATGTAVSGMLQTGGLLIVAGLGLIGLARFRRA